ncbi:hypothetical protein [Ornithinibacillus halotolerans]|uniref:Uncharacterized protein n=1 Tax=Ornithinibacillus halotolerans TaxID=1274357 RepID=A0A916S138_9BACI|nr:hypothetical protein [Ornithinibacillus halotolerans]GGA79749.1 hypothetical protein GCM10008025_23930 [Ornithinibacillus halotolerans]
MSIASISYRSLKNAASEAKSVAKRLDNYADAIDKRVYSKLNSYNGPWSSNLSTAKSNASSKMSTLRDRATNYSKYADDLTDLRAQCETTDRSVKSKVSSLTASFKQRHGIKDNKVISTITSLLTKFENNTAIGRWLGDVRDQFLAGLDDFKQSIKNWFHFEGGKELLKSIGVFVIELALAVATIAVAIISGGALLVIIAGVIGGFIMLLNSFANFANEIKGYKETRADNPVMGQRLRDVNTLSDMMRMEDDKGLHRFASILDGAATVTTIITAVGGIGNLAKKGYKWATGDPSNINNIKIFDIANKQNWSLFSTKLKTDVVNGITDAKRALTMGNWKFFAEYGKEFAAGFAKNFEKDFMNFTTGKDGVKSSKNILSSINSLLNNGANKNTIGGIAVPLIPITSLPGDDRIKGGDVTSIFDGISKGSEGIKKLLNPYHIDQGVMEKLTSPNNTAVGIR